MGLISNLVELLFGSNRNVITDTAEVFRENSENAGVRAADLQSQVVQQFGAEFATGRQNWFDVLIDGLNRLPRPLMALGTLGLICAALVDPVWFAARMQGLALVPEPLWWLMGAIVSFYFGARHQAKGQVFQHAIAQAMARTQDVTRNIAALQQQTPAPLPAKFTTQNAALLEWQAQNWEIRHGS